MSRLSQDVIERIFQFARLDIDTRLALKVRPRRMNTKHMEYLLSYRTGYIYKASTKSLHAMLYPGYHIIRRPINLDYWGELFSIFNEDGEMYWLEVTSPDGRNIMCPHHSDPVVILSSLLRVRN